MNKQRARDVAAALRARGVWYAEARKWYDTGDWIVYVKFSPKDLTTMAYWGGETAEQIIGEHALENLK